MEQDQELAALGAAEGEVTTTEDVTEGQEQSQPAPTEPEGDEGKKTESQLRRERRKAQEQRIREDKEQAEARARQAEERLARLEKRLSGLTEPKEADFSDPLEYAAVKGGWHTQQMTARLEADELKTESQDAIKEAQAAETRRLEGLRDAFIEQVEERRTDFADLDAALAVARNPNIVSHQLSTLVLEAEQPVEVAYYLGKNPNVALELSRMPPHRAAYEIGRIEARMAAPQPKVKSSAPDPITPVKAGANVTRDPLKMNAKEFAEWRAAGGTF